jgi:hypothetical protein
MSVARVVRESLAIVPRPYPRQRDGAPPAASLAAWIAAVQLVDLIWPMMHFGASFGPPPPGSS